VSPGFSWVASRSGIWRNRRSSRVRCESFASIGRQTECDKLPDMSESCGQRTRVAISPVIGVTGDQPHKKIAPSVTLVTVFLHKDESLYMCGHSTAIGPKGWETDMPIRIIQFSLKAAAPRSQCNRWPRCVLGSRASLDG
jgi:hypothetical protein